MSNYPGGLDQFTRKIDNQDTILANDINELQDAIEKIETELGTDPAGTAINVKQRLDNVDIQLSTLTLSDTRINLSTDNVGSHTTLDEHVQDLTIHTPPANIPINYQGMLARTLDQMLRGVLDTGFTAALAPTSTTSAYVLDTGDLVFANTVSNPPGSWYQWLMVTASSSSLASGSSLRLNNSAAEPVFADSSWIDRLQYSTTFPYNQSTSLNIQTGDLVFAHPVANPSTSSYGWFMATADASTSSEIRLDDQSAAPIFADGSQVSTLKPVATAPVTDINLPIASGDIVYCHTSQNPSGTSYAWHLVTAGTSSGVASPDLRLDDAAAAPTFAGTQFSKFPVTQSALPDDTAMPLLQGDIAYCNKTSEPPYDYTWHMVTTGAVGVSNSTLRLDNTALPPSFATGSRFTKTTLQKYQGVARGGEVLEIVYAPDWMIINSVGTGTTPSSTGTAPAVYGNISTKFPLPLSYRDSDYTSISLDLLNFGDPHTSTAFRPRIPAYSGPEDAYYPEVGMQIQLNSGVGSSTTRGIKGAGILNRPAFGEMISGHPTIKAFAPVLASSKKWLAYIPLLARVLDNNDNSQVDVGDTVLVMLTTQGESASPYVSTANTSFTAIDIFKIPGVEPYTGTGVDGELVIDGTFAENSTDGYAHSSAQVQKPGTITIEEYGQGNLAVGTTYYYRISSVDLYGNETDTTTASRAVSTANKGLRMTWTAIDGAVGYAIYGRTSSSDAKYMKTVVGPEYFDDGFSDTPDPSKTYSTENNTDRSYRLDSIKNFTNVTVQNGGIISCSAWDPLLKTFGKIVFYAKGTVFVDSTSKISATAKGYTGGDAYENVSAQVQQGESLTGLGAWNVQSNNAGGGGGKHPGGGGGYGTPGGTPSGGGYGGTTYGSPTLDTLYRGSGGGGYCETYYNQYHRGGNGGGIIYIAADSIIIQGEGAIESDGGAYVFSQGGKVAGGSGGSIYLRANTIDVGVGRVTAKGGNVLTTATNMGGDGRIRFDYVQRGDSESNPAAYKQQL